MLIQLPDDVVEIGYREVKPFHFEQVFRSNSANFEGTEKEFLANGHGYAYIQVDAYTRAVFK